jgi:hypothetical protein
MEDLNGSDKLVVLDTVLQRHARQKLQTMVFCNTIASCRFVCMGTANGTAWGTEAVLH